MSRQRTSAHMVVAELTGAAQRHANWHKLSDEETAAAAAELREILAGRDDGPALLAQVAGLLTGCHAGDDLYEAKARAAAHFCVAAGADETLIPQWAEEGRRRAEASRVAPFSKPGRRAPRRP